MKQMKRRFWAMVLAMALALSLFPTSLIPTARAAEETGGEGGAEAADVTPTPTPTATPKPAFDGGSDLPNLHIDFLGDDSYVWTALPTPKDHDVGLLDHTTPAADAYWSKYVSGNEWDDFVFWVGVGIDSVSAFQLAQEGGLYSTEIAFYYNLDYVEPVVFADAGGSFQDILAYYNLGSNVKNQWSSADYEIAAAMTDLAPVGDPVTEEFAPDGNWSMCYASVQRKNGSTGANRFEGASLPASTDTDTYYLMMIPFRLTGYDPNLQLCFRLARNASMFTVGSGKAGEGLSAEANVPGGGFGAWERETRNPGHNLKEMFDFEGDLNIFTGEHEREKERFTATLNISPGDEPSNGAKLYITNDNSPNPVVAVNSGESITNLQAGTSMTVELTGTVSGYTPTVTVRQVTNTTLTVPLTPVPGDPKKFTFIMPADSVNVNVRYIKDNTSDNFNATLHVVNGGEPLNKDKAAMYDVTGGSGAIAPETPTVIAKDNTVKVEIPYVGGVPDYNTDYDITVTAVTSTGGTVAITEAVPLKEYTFVMPTGDVDVTVTYTKAPTYRVQLSVDAKQDGSIDNVAELYYRDGTGALHTISANDRDGGDPWMVGARDGRQINGIVKFHHPGGAAIPDYQIKKVTLLYSDGVTPPVDLDWRAVTPTDTAADSHMTGWEQLIFMPPPDDPEILMPNQDITIKVEFEKLGEYNVKLVLAGTNAVAGNTAEIHGTDQVMGTFKTTSMPSVDNFDIYSGSTLTLDLYCAPGYKVSKVEARHTSNGALEVPIGGSIDDGYLNYRMPGDNLRVIVTYERIDSNLYEATFQLTQNPSGASNTANWVKEDGTAITPTYPTVRNYSETELEGEIRVLAGWHISSVEVISKTGKAAYPFEISGNGYNNGAGGLVKLTMEQPADNVFVKVTLLKGPPPEAPKQTLNLAVRTEDGQDRAGNRAQLFVNGTSLSSVTTSGGYGIYSAPAGSASMGDAVHVDIYCATGYHVSDVSITPSNAGAALTYVAGATGAAGGVDFVMPAGGVTVTVTYALNEPEDPLIHKVTLHTNAAGQPTPGNTAQIADANIALSQPNIANVDGDYINTYAWDTVTIDVTTSPDRVALVYVIDPDTVPLTPTGGIVPANTGSPKQYTFIAPNRDAEVYVTFVDATDVGDYVATLTVIDDDAQPSTVNGVAGNATLTRSGSGSETTGMVLSRAAPGNTKAITANAGDTMSLTVAPSPGYWVSVAYVDPSGVATLVWSGANAASFVMPNKDVGVVVRFHKDDAAPLYTVDLMVSGPAGAGVASLGTSAGGGIYSQQHSAGDGVDFAITANPGYYIQSVTVTPAPLGITPNLSGTFGSQTGDFVMPAANVYVNVVFAEGYPDTAEYNATLKVIDPASPAGGKALLKNTDPARLNSTAQLTGGQQASVKARTGDVMEVEIQANAGYVPTITITDNAGNPVSYQWTDATHIRFDMAGGPTLVEVRFDKGSVEQYDITLHVTGSSGDSASIEVSPAGTPNVTVTVPSGGAATPGSITAPVGSTITVKAQTAASTHFIQSVIVMRGSDMISITPVAYYNTGTYTGTFAVPEGDVDVYVVMGDTAGPTEMEFPVVLTTVATDGSAATLAGYAEATGTSSAGTATATAQSNDVSAQIIATVGSTVRIQGYPATGYVVSAIRLTPVGSGLSTTVPFTWINGNTVEFTMPSQPLAVEVELKKSNEISTDLTAQVVVNGAGSSNNKGIIHETANPPVAGQTLIHTTNGTNISVDITVASGYEIEYVQLRSNVFGVSNLSLTAAPNQNQTIQFTMLPDDVVVYVKMKKVAPTTFTATLEIVDTSSAFINTATMTSGTNTVSGHGGQLTGLADGASVLTTAIPAATAFANGQVRIVGVLATDSSGTRTLTGSAAHTYSYTINKSDVTITVIYADVGEEPDETTYVAKVVKDDPTNNSSNVATIRNTSNTALPHGDTWTQAWPDHALRVDATAAGGYYAVITAKRDDNGASVPVAQFGFAGNVTAYLNMPGITSSDVTVTVKFVTDPPAVTPNQVQIDLVDASGVGGNWATLTEAANPANTNTDYSSVAGDGPALPNAVMAGSTLNVTGTVATGAYVEKATITANGVTVPITMAGGSGSVAMPAIDTSLSSAAVVTVYVAAGDQSGRPYDPNHDPNTKGYIPGYLEAQNLGGGRAHIQVPYLYDSGATHDATKNVLYQLYVKTGSGYVRLVPGTDYEVTVGYDEYTTIPGTFGTGIGTEFTIRALKGNTCLSDWLINGGVIYITATEDGKTESEFVEVELPADPDRGSHKATLRIVDFSHVTGNGASMSEGYRVVNVDGGILNNLRGSELIKTDVTVATGATLVNVTVTDSTGTRPLSPDATGRYPYDMTGEDIVITVYFDDVGTTDDPELYIATVQKAGLHGVAGNGADIHNDTRNDLPNGVIWAAGYAGNDMVVDVTTAAGYYAVVTAYGERTGNQLPVVQLGAGSATAAMAFQAFVSIPNYAPATPDGEDVRVVVTYTKDPPPGYESQLTLTTVGTDSLTNTATLQPNGMGAVTSTGDGTWLVPDGTTPPTAPTTLVSAGTTLNLTTICDTTGNIYYVDSVVVSVASTPAGSMTITLDANGAASFPMPLGAADVKVTWKHDPHTPRPFDPAHDTTVIPAPATQPGWILAEHTVDGNGDTTDNGLKIIVPLLHDDNTTIYEHAITTVNPDDIIYKLYVKDAYGTYHELTTADISRTATVMTAGIHNSATFELTSLLPASTLHYYIKHGGVIYITATDVGATPRSESKYTQVVIPANYTATLHVSQGTVTGNIAKLAEGGRSVTAPPTRKLTGLSGTETLKTTVDNLAAGSHLVSVIATTASAGSTHLNLVSGSYDYTMIGEDVDVYVVFQDNDDPLGDMYTATVKRVNDDGKAGNTASIVNEDVSGVPAGSIWTGAYATNVVRVDVTTEPGYYAIVTAAQTGTGVPVPVVQWATQGTAASPAKTHFTMPAHDVDVTVTYTTTPPDPHDLSLTLQQTGGAVGNSATLDAPNAANSVTVLGNSVSLTQFTPNQVHAGTALTLTTATDAGYAVDKAYMIVTTAVGTVTVDIPLTNGVSLPLASMPLGNAEVVVVYKPGHQTPRPYDPAHAHIYTGSYNHNTADDKSQTHQDGWILAQPTGKDSFQLTVPVLHDMSGTGGTDQLHHAGYADASQPDYTLYWRDSLGFHMLSAADITISGQTVVPNAYTQGTTNYNGYQFDVKINNPMSVWGGYHLLDYLANGGSIYITATGKATAPVPDVESEKTEVVIPVNDRYTATLHIVDTSGLTGNGVRMAETGGTQSPVTVDGGQLTGLLAGATVNTLITALNANARIAGVVATTDSGSVNLVDGGGNSYNHIMGNSDVDIYVILQSKTDPLGNMYTAAVHKVDPDNKPNNTADVIVNEDVPTAPHGIVWTGAYENNVVRVDVTTETGYYATVTAVRKGTTTPVPVVQWAVQGTAANPARSQFYMPAADVDVTVTFSDTAPTYGTLDLTLTGATDSNPLNTSTLSEDGVAGNAITVSGNDASLTRRIPSNRVTAGADLKLVTAADTANDYAVKDAKLKITVPVGGGTGSQTVTVDVPLTNGESLPLFAMPLGDAEVIVTYVDKSNQTPRPYDPIHSTAFNGANYPATVPDKSSTHQEGWLLATPTGTDSFHLVVPTLHDMSGTGGTDKLHNAGYDPTIPAQAAKQPTYKLYWRDKVGAFHAFTAADINVTNPNYISAGNPGSYPGYDGWEFDVKIVSSTALWGGYHLTQYLKEGGSIYITATGPNSTVDPVDLESEKTEVVVPKTYTATLHISDVSGVPGSTVTMSETGSGQSVNTDNGKIVALAGNETINTLIAPVSAAVRVVGVVATTENGSVNLTNTGASGTYSYDYTMQQTDVDIYAVIQSETDPLEDMYIATVYKKDTDNRPGNKAEVIVNEDVTDVPHGPVWTGAYGGNVIRVDVETENGYYAKVTAVEHGTTTPVKVVQWGSTGSFSSQFYMVEHDVDVTVEFTTTPPANGYLYLTLDQPTGVALADNMAQLTANAISVAVHGSDATVSMVPVPAATIPVQAGLPLDLTAGAAPTCAVTGAVMKITLPGNTSGNPDFTVDIPLTDGKALPKFQMPLADAEVVVSYESGHQTPRPYDPEHAHAYTNSYNHNTTDDKSSTHQDGWIMAVPTGSDSFTLTVPTLHDMDTAQNPAADRLHHAGYDPTNPTEAAKQPTYKLYWRDSVGVFTEITDITITYQNFVPNAYTVGTDSYNGYQLDVQVNNVYEKWGGYHVAQYIANGGSIYITATGADTSAPDLESEKTEVVFPKHTHTATLHISDVSALTGNVVTMSEVGGTQAAVTTDGGQLTDLTHGTTVKTAISPLNANARVAGVVATVNGSSVNLTDAGSNVYNYVMGNDDVDIYVVIESTKDPLPDMYIATVEKKDPDNKPNNTVSIVNEDVSSVPSGPVWTGAYQDNGIRVDVTTEPNYYAKVTAVKHGTTDPVKVVQWGTTGSFSSQFYMPAADVDVTVEFTTQKPDAGTLSLTLAGATDNKADNSATVSVPNPPAPPTNTTVTGADAVLTQSAGQVEPGVSIDLTTTADIANNYAVEKVELKVTLPGNTSGTPDFVLDVPLTDGKALPPITMPLGNAEVVVTYKSGVKQTARPYDPKHSDAFNAAPGGDYKTAANPDKSQTGQEGWLLAEPIDAKSFHLVVPTLHDMDATQNPAVDRLHHAGYDPTNPTEAAKQPSYQLYWRDSLGVFQAFTAADITVSASHYIPAGDPGSYPGYGAWEFDVSVNPDPTNVNDNTYPTLWGGFTLKEYLQNGGSIYISATGPNTAGTPADMESEKTEVVIPGIGKYKATLVYLPNGNAATMTAWSNTTTVSGGVLTGNNGTETVKVDAIAPGDTPSAADTYRLVGVVATTASGSVNATPNAARTEFTYTMDEQDVEMRVVFDKKDDPLDPKGPHIVTVLKKDDDDKPGNGATVKDLDVDIPGHQKGTIWTAAYEGNVVQVDVTCESGYYAVVTAKTAPGGAQVNVAQFAAGTGNNCYAQFYMPAGTDVDVTVTYIHDTPPQHELELEVVSTLADAANSANITASGAAAPILSADGVNTAAGPVSVASGTPLELTTGHANGWSVKSAVMKVKANGAAAATVDIPIPLTDGVSLPIPAMPMADAKIVVTFQNKPLMPRPFDPLHDHDYTPAYVHDVPAGTNPGDLSRTHQDGWLQAVTYSVSDDTIIITVPTLHDMDTTQDPAVDRLHHAGYDPEGADAAKQPKYNLYWKDELGAFHPFSVGTAPGDDIEITDGRYVPAGDPGSYSPYGAYEFRVKVNEDSSNPHDQTYPTLWGGYTLHQYINDGGSIYITAVDPASPAAALESEMTEVVIPAGKRYKATLHFETAEGGATMNAWGSSATTDGQTLSGTVGTEKVTVVPAPDSNHVTVGVVATTDAGSVNATWNASLNRYEYDMVNKDVDIYVVFDSKDDPLQKKGPHIVTVLKKGDDGYTANNATVTDLDVDIPATQKGTIWTAAYEGNVVQVDVTCEPGYYPRITAVRKNGGAAVDVAPFTNGTNAYYGKFYMPGNTDVDVTVEFIAGTPPACELRLTVAGGDGLAANRATVSMTNGVSLNANGAGPTQAGPVNVTPGASLTLTTAHNSIHSVKSAVMKVNGTTVNIDIPLTDGESLPIPVMPMASTEIIVTFQQKQQVARPYDPLHSDAYNAAPGGDYKTADNPDKSETGQEGWLLATAIDPTEKSFVVTVPTLHDKGGAYGADQLYHAGYDPAGADAALQPKYNLYWKDSLGNFQPLSSTDIDISPGQYVAAAYTEQPSGDVYNGYRFKVTVKEDSQNPADQTYPTLWGGYTVLDYIKNGGSLYITALDPNSAGKAESEKTELVLPPKTEYTATLHFTPNGTAATMSVPAWGAGKVTSTDGDTLSGADGTATVKVNAITPDTGYKVVGVVATTLSGSKNALPNGDNTEYTYTMVKQDVDMQVVFRKTDDPLQEKGPHIVTVYKVDDDGKAGNTAKVKDLDVPIPSTQRGDIWTAAYVGNTVQVDVTTAAGYYAVITAVKAGTTTPVEIVQYPDKGLFEMIDDDVDVTVKYVKAATLPTYELKLTTTGMGGASVVGNSATLSPAGMSGVGIVGADSTVVVSSAVPAGTGLKLTTGHGGSWSVKSAVMKVAGVTVPIEIPLTDGVSLPDPAMPMANAEVVVTFQSAPQNPRPYDPEHANEYNSAYHHNTADDLSRTHQDGWIKAYTYNMASDTVTITVPVLHDMDTTQNPAEDRLYHAGYDPAGSDADKQPKYKLYWRDGIGNFQELTQGTGKDVTVSDGTWLEDYYTDAAHDGQVYDGYRFNVKLNPATPLNPHDNTYPTLWGGYTLWQYIQNGGSLYISTLDSKDPATVMESEKTEVVIRAKTPRPFDPDHSEDYSSTYNHATDDLSQTHDEGWIKGSTYNIGSDAVLITVPTLHGKWGTVPPGTLYDTVEDYKFYYKDTDGSFVELVVGTDIELEDETVKPQYYTDTLHGSAQYDGYSFKVKVKMTTGSDPQPATTGGEKLAGLIADGGSIFITAIDNVNSKDESDKTEVVLGVSDGLRPFDPESKNSQTDPTPYEDYWITSENRGDYLVVTVPILAQDDGSDKTNVDKTKHTFQFYLKDEKRAADTTNYPNYEPEELSPILELSHPDPENDTGYNEATDPPYENDSYYSESDGGIPPTVTKYKGARFIVKVKTDADIDKWVDDWAQAQTAAGNPPAAADVTARKDRLKELAQMVRKLMDNEGTTEAIKNGVDWTDDGVDNKGKYRLYITHTDSGETPEFVSKLVDFEIPKYYAFNGILESYAPKHAATFTLYPLKDGATDPTDDAQYETDAFLTYDLTQEFGTGLWQQDFSVKSSHLMKRDKSGQVYKLVVFKPGHVSYTWLGLELTPATLDVTGDLSCLTFTLDPDVNGGMIALIGGDFDGNGANGLEDLEIITNIMAGEIPYNRQTDDTQSDWGDSVFNPDSLAYAADLDGNGKVTGGDLKILNDYRNFRQTSACYQAVMPKLKNASQGNLGGGVVMALLLEEPLPKWVLDMQEEGKKVPDWAMTLLLDGRELPGWAIECIQAQIGIPAWAVKRIEDEKEVPAWATEIISAGGEVPAWAVECVQAQTEVPAWVTEIIKAGREVPTWVVECVKAKTEIPLWATEIVKVRQEVPGWAVDCVKAGTEVPAWATEMVTGEKTVPVWATEMIARGKTIPAWAIELAQAGEELPQDMATLVANGEDLPEELPAAPAETPAVPADPAGTVGSDVPAGSNGDVGADDPGGPAVMPSDPDAPSGGTDDPTGENDGSDDPNGTVGSDVPAGSNGDVGADDPGGPAVMPSDPDAPSGGTDDPAGENDGTDDPDGDVGSGDPTGDPDTPSGGTDDPAGENGGTDDSNGDVGSGDPTGDPDTPSGGTEGVTT